MCVLFLGICYLQVTDSSKTSLILLPFPFGEHSQLLFLLFNVFVSLKLAVLSLVKLSVIYFPWHYIVAYYLYDMNMTVHMHPYQGWYVMFIRSPGVRKPELGETLFRKTELGKKLFTP